MNTRRQLQITKSLSPPLISYVHPKRIRLPVTFANSVPQHSVWFMIVPPQELVKSCLSLRFWRISLDPVVHVKNIIMLLITGKVSVVHSAQHKKVLEDWVYQLEVLLDFKSWNCKWLACPFFMEAARCKPKRWRLPCADVSWLPGIYEGQRRINLQVIKEGGSNIGVLTLIVCFQCPRLRRSLQINPIPSKPPSAHHIATLRIHH